MLDTGRMTATAGEAVSGLYLRVYVSTGAANTITPPTVSIAGISDDDLGVLPRVAASGDEVSVDLYNKPGTMNFQAAGAITGGALFYPAASGKVSATAAGAPIGRAVTPASGNGAIFEGQVFPRSPATPRRIADVASGSAISVAVSGTCAMTSTGADTRTLAAPTFEGQRIMLTHGVDGGSVAVTASTAINEAGNTVMTFTDAKEAIELEGVLLAATPGTMRWQVVGNTGVTLS